MQSVIASFALAALAGLANAVEFTNSAYDITAGQSFTLTWDDGTGPYQILLKNGPSTDLSTVSTLVPSTTEDSAVIVLPSSLTTDTYAFQIVDTADQSSNYSPQFAFAGAAAVTTVTSASSTTTQTTLASSTTSGSSTASNSSASTTGSSSATDSSSTHASTTTSGSSTRTSSSASSSSTVASTNNGVGMKAPFAAVIFGAAALAAF